MFWFDRQNPDAIYIDKRAERRVLTDTTRVPGSRMLNVAPDILANFTALPFPEASFWHVIFDPPHLPRDERLLSAMEIERLEREAAALVPPA